MNTILEHMDSGLAASNKYMSCHCKSIEAHKNTTKTMGETLAETLEDIDILQHW